LEEAEKIYRMSRNFSLFIGMVSLVLLVWQGRAVVGIFGTSAEVTEYVIEVLPIFLWGMVFAGISRAVISFLCHRKEYQSLHFDLWRSSIVRNSSSDFAKSNWNSGNLGVSDAKPDSGSST